MTKIAGIAARCRVNLFLGPTQVILQVFYCTMPRNAACDGSAFEFRPGYAVTLTDDLIRCDNGERIRAAPKQKVDVQFVRYHRGLAPPT